MDNFMLPLLLYFAIKNDGQGIRQLAGGSD